MAADAVACAGVRPGCCRQAVGGRGLRVCRCGARGSGQARGRRKSRASSTSCGPRRQAEVAAVFKRSSRNTGRCPMRSKSLDLADGGRLGSVAAGIRTAAGYTASGPADEVVRGACAGRLPSHGLSRKAFMSGRARHGTRRIAGAGATRASGVLAAEPHLPAVRPRDRRTARCAELWRGLAIGGLVLGAGQLAADLSCPTAPRRARRGSSAPATGRRRSARACRPPGWRWGWGCVIVAVVQAAGGPAAGPDRRKRPISPARRCRGCGSPSWTPRRS